MKLERNRDKSKGEPRLSDTHLVDRLFSKYRFGNRGAKTQHRYKNTTHRNDWPFIVVNKIYEHPGRSLVIYVTR